MWGLVKWSYPKLLSLEHVHPRAPVWKPRLDPDREWAEGLVSSGPSSHRWVESR